MRTKTISPLHWNYPVPRFRILFNSHIDGFHPPTCMPLNRAAYIAYGQWSASRPPTEYYRSIVTIKHQYVRKPKSL